jgi:drug/metabolite transporter (DMT)-like permease
MRKNVVITGAIAISISAIMWGLDGVVLTPRLYNLDVGYVVFMLHAIPFVIMHSFLYKQYSKLRSFSGKDFLVLLMIAAFGGAIGTLAIVKALFLVNFQNLSVVVLLQKLQPIFAIALAALLLKEKLRYYFILWGSIAIGAGYFLTFGLNAPNLYAGSSTPLAAGYALLAAISFGSSTVFSKMFLQKYDFKTATFYRYGLTALIMLIYVIVRGKFDQLEITTANNWVIFLVIAFTTGSGAIFLYYYGLVTVPATIAIICELFFPLSTIVFDYLVNNNQLSVVQWISVFVMIFAIINLNRSHSKTMQRWKRKSHKTTET